MTLLEQAMAHLLLQRIEEAAQDLLRLPLDPAMAATLREITVFATGAAEQLALDF